MKQANPWSHKLIDNEVCILGNNDFPSLNEVLGEYGEVKPYKRSNRYYVEVDPRAIRSVVKKLLDTYNDVYISTITPVDYLKEGVIEINYELEILPLNVFLVVKTKIPRDKAEIDSLVDILPGAKVLEQEAYDLMGVLFKGNPHLRKPFLLPEEMATETPLRKDWKPK